MEITVVKVERIEATLRRHFHVEYVTIQVEVGGVTCQTDTLEQ